MHLGFPNPLEDLFYKYPSNLNPRQLITICHPFSRERTMSSLKCFRIHRMLHWVNNWQELLIFFSYMNQQQECLTLYITSSSQVVELHKQAIDLCILTLMQHSGSVVALKL